MQWLPIVAIYLIISLTCDNVTIQQLCELYLTTHELYSLWDAIYCLAVLNSILFPSSATFTVTAWFTSLSALLLLLCKTHWKESWPEQWLLQRYRGHPPLSTYYSISSLPWVIWNCTQTWRRNTWWEGVETKRWDYTEVNWAFVLVDL